MAFQLKVTIFTLIFGVALGQIQRSVLYDQYNADGDYVVIPEDYVPDLGSIGFDNRPHSACVTGIWLLYQDANYNPNGGRGMEYIFGRNNYCVNIRTIAGTVSSVRYAGQPKDYTADSLTLYKYDYFQGEEEYTVSQLPNLNLADDHQSIIITGNSDWTVYDAPNYIGNTICLRVPEPGNSVPSFISDLRHTDPSIPHGSIRSVRKGCTSREHNVTFSSFARMQSSFAPTKLV